MIFIKKNINVVLLLMVLVVTVGVSLHNMIQESNVEQITIQNGDTLFALAKEHRGDMSESTWLHRVTSENNLRDDQIIAGEELWIPATIKNDTKMEIASDK